MRADTVVATHTNTDFDAFAAMLAARRLYPGAVVCLAGSPNRNGPEFYRLRARDSRGHRLAHAYDDDTARRRGARLVPTPRRRAGAALALPPYPARRDRARAPVDPARLARGARGGGRRGARRRGDSAGVR